MAQFQGGSGVQPFQMAVAVALQSLNGILFARFVGLEKRLEVFLAAAFLCLYPAFLDYYSFAMDHITSLPRPRPPPARLLAALAFEANPVERAGQEWS